MSRHLPHRFPHLRTIGRVYGFELWLAAASVCVLVVVGVAYFLTAAMGPLR